MPKKTLCPTHLNFQPRPTYPYAPGAQREVDSCLLPDK